MFQEDLAPTDIVSVVHHRRDRGTRHLQFSLPLSLSYSLTNLHSSILTFVPGVVAVPSSPDPHRGREKERASFCQHGAQGDGTVSCWFKFFMCWENMCSDKKMGFWHMIVVCCVSLMEDTKMFFVSSI